MEDSSPSLSPTIATNKRPRQASDVVKGKGKATTRIAKRPKLVEASPTLEHVHLNDDSAIPNSAPAMSGNTNAASAGASTDSWTTNENVNGFSAAPATSSWAPPHQTQSVQDSSANPEYRAVQHPPPSRPSQNSSPYPPPSQPHPQPATSSPNWGHHATQSPHHVPTFVPTPAPPSGYSSAAPATAAPTTSQHNLLTPSPPSAPIPQHSSSGSMPVSAPLPRPSRHTYDVAPPHETPYGSPLEMHAPPPGNANSQGPGVTYGPAYGRYYTPQAPSQSPSSKSQRSSCLMSLILLFQCTRIRLTIASRQMITEIASFAIAP